MSDCHSGTGDGVDTLRSLPQRDRYKISGCWSSYTYRLLHTTEVAYDSDRSRCVEAVRNPNKSSQSVGIYEERIWNRCIQEKLPLWSGMVGMAYCVNEVLSLFPLIEIYVKIVLNLFVKWNFLLCERNLFLFWSVFDELRFFVRENRPSLVVLLNHFSLWNVWELVLRKRRSRTTAISLLCFSVFPGLNYGWALFYFWQMKLLHTFPVDTMGDIIVKVVTLGCKKVWMLFLYLFFSTGSFWIDHRSARNEEQSFSRILFALSFPRQ